MAASLKEVREPALMRLLPSEASVQGALRGWPEATSQEEFVEPVKKELAKFDRSFW